MNEAPSAWRIEQAMAAYQSARARLLADDLELAADEAALAEILGPKEEDVMDALAQTLRAARHAESMAKAANEMAKDIQARKTRYENRAQSARSTAFAILEALDMKKFEMPDLSVSIRNGQQNVLVTDETLIPDIYVHVERKPDRATILSALKAGITVEGCSLTNGLPSLSIRKT